MASRKLTTEERRRRRIQAQAFVRQRATFFLWADGYARRERIRHGYDWCGHLGEGSPFASVLDAASWVLGYRRPIDRPAVWRVLYRNWTKIVKPKIKSKQL